MRQHSATPADSTSSAAHFDLSGLSGITRKLERAFVQPFTDYKRQPKDAKAAGAKARIMAGRSEAITALLRVSFAAIDAGIPWVAMTAWARQYIEIVRDYAERRQRRLGIVTVLAFPDRWTRVQATDSIEEGEANAACWSVKDDDPASLERARKELIDQRTTVDAQIALLDERLAVLAVS